jgi:hypothetical protein
VRLGHTVYFGETGRLFRLKANAHFGGDRTLISVPNRGTDRRRGWKRWRMVGGVCEFGRLPPGSHDIAS